MVILILLSFFSLISSSHIFALIAFLASHEGTLRTCLIELFPGENIFNNLIFIFKYSFDTPFNILVNTQKEHEFKYADTRENMQLDIWLPNLDLCFEFQVSDSLYSLMIVCCLLFVVCCLLFVVCCLLFIVHCLLFIVYCLLFIVYCLLFIVYCYIIYYFLFGIC